MVENVPWRPLPDGMSPSDEPMTVPQELYDALMELPDGSDVTEYFETDDPAWRVMQITLARHNAEEASLICRSLIDMVPEAPPGAVPGAAEGDGEGDGWV